MHLRYANEDIDSFFYDIDSPGKIGASSGFASTLEEINIFNQFSRRVTQNPNGLLTDASNTYLNVNFNNWFDFNVNFFAPSPLINSSIADVFTNGTYKSFSIINQDDEKVIDLPTVEQLNPFSTGVINSLDYHNSEINLPYIGFHNIPVINLSKILVMKVGLGYLYEGTVQGNHTDFLDNTIRSANDDTLVSQRFIEKYYLNISRQLFAPSFNLSLFDDLILVSSTLNSIGFVDMNYNYQHNVGITNFLTNSVEGPAVLDYGLAGEFDFEKILNIPITYRVELRHNSSKENYFVGHIDPDPNSSSSLTGVDGNSLTLGYFQELSDVTVGLTNEFNIYTINNKVTFNPLRSLTLGMAFEIAEINETYSYAEDIIDKDSPSKDRTYTNLSQHRTGSQYHIDVVADYQFKRRGNLYFSVSGSYSLWNVTMTNQFGSGTETNLGELRTLIGSTSEPFSSLVFSGRNFRNAFPRNTILFGNNQYLLSDKILLDPFLHLGGDIFFNENYGVEVLYRGFLHAVNNNGSLDISDSEPLFDTGAQRYSISTFSSISYYNDFRTTFLIKKKNFLIGIGVYTHGTGSSGAFLPRIGFRYNFDTKGDSFVRWVLQYDYSDNLSLDLNNLNLVDVSVRIKY